MTRQDDLFAIAQSVESRDADTHELRSVQNQRILARREIAVVQHLGLERAAMVDLPRIRWRLVQRKTDIGVHPDRPIHLESPHATTDLIQRHLHRRASHEFIGQQQWNTAFGSVANPHAAIRMLQCVRPHHCQQGPLGHIATGFRHGNGQVAIDNAPVHDHWLGSDPLPFNLRHANCSRHVRLDGQRRLAEQYSENDSNLL